MKSEKEIFPTLDEEEVISEAGYILEKALEEYLDRDKEIDVSLRPALGLNPFDDASEWVG